MNISGFAARHLRSLVIAARGPQHRPPIPQHLRKGTRRPVSALHAVLFLSALIYVGAHIAIVTEVWEVHGTAGRALTLLRVDIVAIFIWAAALISFRKMKYRGNWALIVLPFALFLIARPSVFHARSDPAYVPDSGRSRAEAVEYKGQRARYAVIEAGYDHDRKAVMRFGSLVPPPMITPGPFNWSASALALLLAPLALLLGFCLGKQRRLIRLVRDKRKFLLLSSALAIVGLSVFFAEAGRVGSTTPWEFFLVVFVVLWAAHIADDAHNLSGVAAVRRPFVFGRLLLYGALPVALFVVLPRTRDLGIAVVLAISLAVMLIVGTRQRWWILLMGVVWVLLVAVAFRYDERSATRLHLAYQPYTVPTGADSMDASRWAGKVYQIKLFDANVLAGGFFGKGPGQGHGETAPNAADDGFMTLFAADWGVLGAFSLMATYTWLLLTIVLSAGREPGAFKRSLVVGIAMLIGVPFWLSSLAAVHILPLTGVAMAFVAHGGSKLLATSFALGLIAATSHETALYAPQMTAQITPQSNR